LFSHYKEGHQIQSIQDVLTGLRGMIEEMEVKVNEFAKENEKSIEDNLKKLDEYTSNKDHFLQE
jgi:TolA-binding protein